MTILIYCAKNDTSDFIYPCSTCCIPLIPALSQHWIAKENPHAWRNHITM